MALTSDAWLNHLNSAIESSAKPISLNSFVEILERFDQAERDYLCELKLLIRLMKAAAILLRHLDFILLCSSSQPTTSEASSLEVEADVTEFLAEDATRDMLRGVEQRGQGLLSESHLLWQPWLDWEMGLLRSASDTRWVTVSSTADKQ